MLVYVGDLIGHAYLDVRVWADPVRPRYFVGGAINWPVSANDE